MPTSARTKNLRRIFLIMTCLYLTAHKVDNPYVNPCQASTMNFIHECLIDCRDYRGSYDDDVRYQFVNRFMEYKDGQWVKRECFWQELKQWIEEQLENECSKTLLPWLIRDIFDSQSHLDMIDEEVCCIAEEIDMTDPNKFEPST